MAAVRPSGQWPGGRTVHECTLANRRCLMLRAINCGAIVTERCCPGRDGRCANVVRGFDPLTDDAARNPNFGKRLGHHLRLPALQIIPSMSLQ